MPKMNQRIKELWVMALESDLYDQNFGNEEKPLRTKDDRWSPFGVLCNIHAQEHLGQQVEECDAESYHGYSFLTPVNVRRWAELDENHSGKFDQPFEIMGRTYQSVYQMAQENVSFFLIAGAIHCRF